MNAVATSRLTIAAFAAAMLGLAQPVAAQSNPLLDFWLDPLGLQGQQQGTTNRSAAAGPGARGTGVPASPADPVYRAPGQNVHDALWDDPFDPGRASTTAYDEDFSDSPQPVDMANTVPILSTETVESLKGAIARYQQIVTNGGWPVIGPGETLSVGSKGPRVAILRQRLSITGDLRQQSGQADAYDSFVYQAVVEFQQRHGLRPNGRVDERTLNALNVPARSRLDQLGINLDRISKLMGGLADRYVMVNIPGAEVEAVNNGIVESRHRTVVGKLDRPSPIVHSRVVELNFYPYWHVPESIVRRDLVPTIQEDFDYLQRTNLRVFTDWSFQNEIDPTTVDWHSPEALELKFRQEPGEGNALGFVKINFPNEHAVYWHDTPKRRLFGDEVRADSSGCVRIQNVDDLAAWLLAGQDDWNGAKVQQVIQDGQSMNVGLKTNVQLHMIYVTAWATADGVVHFRRDLYGRDGVGELAANY